MINVGIVGYGYWGPNVLRNFNIYPFSQVVSVADVLEKNLKRAKSSYPNIVTTTDYKEITRSKVIDIVAIVTPVEMHYAIGKEALENGKHIFVEKPLAINSQQAEELTELAEKKGLLIMVDHTFLFTDAVRKIKELIDKQELGNLLYYDATRVNLGLFRQDVNVIWDLAPHDFSIMTYLIQKKPQSLSCLGMDHFERGLYNTAYVTMYLEGLIAHFNFNWLSPVKIRSTYIGGDKKMIVWDDLKSDEKIKIYDKGIVIENHEEDIYRQKVAYRLGDMCSPQLSTREALNKEIEYFLTCINQKQKPINDGSSGLQVVKLLEAADFSIKNQGRLVKL